ncbi:MAG: ROK family protein, partial [Mycetocola sp.]
MPGDITPVPEASLRDVLRLLRDGTPRTRSQIITETGLARSTVNARLDQLRQTEILRDAGEAASSGGRRPSRIAFDPRARFIGAIDIGASHASVALTDLNGTILRTAPVTVDLSAPGGTAITTAARALGALLRDGDPELAAVGVGIPGPVEHALGRPVAPPMMPHWHNLDIPAIINAELHAPALVDNDVNLLALAERSLTMPDEDNIFYLKVATGIGAGIIAGGVLQRGWRGSAGDFGHVRVPHSPAFPRDADDDRDLEALAAGPAIVAQLVANGVDAATTADAARL